MKDLMKNNKLIIGMIHFPPLPGTPEFNDDENLSNIIETVIKDLENLQAHQTYYPELAVHQTIRIKLPGRWLQQLILKEM